MCHLNYNFNLQPKVQITHRHNKSEFKKSYRIKEQKNAGRSPKELIQQTFKFLIRDTESLI